MTYLNQAIRNLSNHLVLIDTETWELQRFCRALNGSVVRAGKARVHDADSDVIEAGDLARLVEVFRLDPDIINLPEEPEAA